MLLEVTDKTFYDTINSDGITIIDFWAEWCGPCRAYGPILESFSTEVNDVTVAKINVDENPEMSFKYGVRSIPTTLIFKDGQLITKVPGVIQKQQLNQFVENLR